MATQHNHQNTSTPPETKTVTVPPEAVAALAGQVAGPVLTPDDPEYASETATFNQSLPHRPVLAVGATSAADVQAAVSFAAAHGLPVAVLATGHGAVVSADGSVLINTKRLAGVTIDQENRVARVEAGVRWQQVVDAAAKAGLAPIAGSSPNVGVVAYHLGGGLSPVLGRPYGYAADHMISVDVVTADGRLRHVTAVEEPGLFWALRGGKGNFGVATAIEFQLFPITRYFGGGIFFDGEHTAAVLKAYQVFVQHVPEEMSSSVLLMRTPDIPQVPEPLRGKLVVHLRIAYLGHPSDGEDLVAPLRAAAPALIDYVGETPFQAIASIHQDPSDPMPVHERTALLSHLPPAAVRKLVELAGPDAESPVTAAEIRHLGGALRRAPRIPNAVENRSAGFSLFAGHIAGPDQAADAVLDRLIEGMSPWATGGTYLNFMSSADTAAERVRAAYSPATFERLLVAKEIYDPTNMFRINHNLRRA